MRIGTIGQLEFSFNWLLIFDDPEPETEYPESLFTLQTPLYSLKCLTILLKPNYHMFKNKIKYIHTFKIITSIYYP